MRLLTMCLNESFWMRAGRRSTDCLCDCSNTSSLCCAYFPQSAGGTAGVPAGALPTPEWGDAAADGGCVYVNVWVLLLIMIRINAHLNSSGFAKYCVCSSHAYALFLVSFDPNTMSGLSLHAGADHEASPPAIILHEEEGEGAETAGAGEPPSSSSVPDGNKNTTTDAAAQVQQQQALQARLRLFAARALADWGAELEQRRLRRALRRWAVRTWEGASTGGK